MPCRARPTTLGRFHQRPDPCTGVGSAFEPVEEVLQPVDVDLARSEPATLIGLVVDHPEPPGLGGDAERSRPGSRRANGSPDDGRSPHVRASRRSAIPLLGWLLRVDRRRSTAPRSRFAGEDRRGRSASLKQPREIPTAPRATRRAPRVRATAERESATADHRQAAGERPATRALYRRGWGSPPGASLSRPPARYRRYSPPRCPYVRHVGDPRLWISQAVV